MSKMVIDLEDWNEIYNGYMKSIEDHIQYLKEDIADDLEHDWDYTAMEHSREWYEYTSMKNLLNNINDAVKELYPK